MDSKILREYLVALGFRVKADEARGFDKTVTGVTDKVFKLGGAAIATAGALQAMVMRFSNGMERMYYDSRRADSTVERIQAMEFGAGKIGLTAEKVTSSVIGMKNALRMNPGMSALLEQLGVEVKGRDMADVMTDMVAQLRKMPFYVGAQFAQMFGMDPDTFLLMSEGLEKFNEAQAEMIRRNREAGLDLNKAAEVAKEYNNQLRDMKATFDTLANVVADRALPYFKDFAGVVNELGKDWIKIAGKLGAGGSANKDGILKTLGWSLLGLIDPTGKANPMVHGGIQLSGESKRRIAMGELNGMAGAGRGSANDPRRLDRGGAGGASGSVDFGAIERKYGLPAGLLDRMWEKESGRGRNMLSPAGAQGHFQFMPGTAAQYGVDPYDLASSADGAGRYMRDLMGMFGGDLRTGLAAYNWGPGNVKKHGLGRAPAEARDYMSMADGLSIGGPQATITFHGVSDPREAARLAADEQQRVNADWARNLSSVVQ